MISSVSEEIGLEILFGFLTCAYLDKSSLSRIMNWKTTAVVVQFDEQMRPRHRPETSMKSFGPKTGQNYEYYEYYNSTPVLYRSHVPQCSGIVLILVKVLNAVIVVSNM
jgi:hypothetical protein